MLAHTRCLCLHHSDVMCMRHAGSCHGSSLVVMSKGTRYTQQSYKVSDAFPFEWIKKKWKENFYITSMATAGVCQRYLQSLLLCILTIVLDWSAYSHPHVCAMQHCGHMSHTVYPLDEGQLSLVVATKLAVATKQAVHVA